MTQSKSLLGVVLAMALLAGCSGHTATSTTPPAAATATQESSLAADAAALGPDTESTVSNYSVQQYGGMMNNDGRWRIGMHDGNYNSPRMMWDDNRIRRIHPRVVYLFNRYPAFFHNVYASNIYTLRSTLTLEQLRRLFPELDDATLLLILERLYLVRNYDVYNTSFPYFIRPFVVRRSFPHIHHFPRHGRY